jgi:chlorobactene glucosyltransferase
MDVDVDFFLLLSLVGVTVTWMSLFVLSIRSNYLIPVIDRSKIARVQTVILSSSSHESVENVIEPSKNGEVSNISLPFVSIIVPARNEGENIKKCLISLLSQSYPNFELIAIDDSSADNTLQIMNKIKDGLDIDLEPSIKTDKMKIISLTDKPDKWTGKTWASHHGYLRAQGEILLFTDADTCFFDKDALFHAVSYFQNENLDVLTGHAKIELPNFWSKITMPLWDFFSITLDQNTSAVNSTSSSAGYLVGSFYIIRRKVLEFLGGFNCVQEEIKEDVELGRLIKRAGFRLRIVKMDKFYSALWSRDLLSLWHGIRRTFFGMNKFRVFANLISLFLLTIFPFLILPHTFSSFHTAAGTIGQSVGALVENNMTNTNDLARSLLTILDISCCIMITIGTAIKDVRKYNISPIYSLLTFPGAVVLIFAYVTSIFALFTWSKKLQWRSRSYEYKIGN